MQAEAAPASNGTVELKTEVASTTAASTTSLGTGGSGTTTPSRRLSTGGSGSKGGSDGPTGQTMSMFINKALQSIFDEAPKRNTKLRESCTSAIGAHQIYQSILQSPHLFCGQDRLILCALIHSLIQIAGVHILFISFICSFGSLTKLFLDVVVQSC
jgi:hypothetical protein